MLMFGDYERTILLLLTYYLITVHAVVHRVGGHQTHAVPGAAENEMIHCGPRVLFRVVDNHVR